LLGVSASSASAVRGDRLGLDVYSAVVRGGQLGELNRDGVDVSVQGKVARGFDVQLILNDNQRAKLEAAGIDTKLARVKGGRTVKQFAVAQAESGFNVWRSWDEPGGIRDEMYAVARDNPQLAKLVRLGTTLQGREILALKLTQGARGQAEPRRLRVHVRRRAAVAQEPARQRRRRTDDDRRRCRSQPQLSEPLHVRRGGLLVDPLEPDLPWPVCRLRA
jgi:hypothetical protein